MFDRATVQRLADGEVAGVCECDWLQVRSGDLQQRKIMHLICAYDGGLVGALVAGLDFDAIGVGDDVKVGENVTSLVQNETGTLTYISPPSPSFRRTPTRANKITGGRLVMGSYFPV